MLRQSGKRLLIFFRRKLYKLAKATVKVALVTEPCGKSRFGHAFPFLQQPLCFPDAALDLELMRRETADILKLTDHMIRAYTDLRRHCLYQ